MISGQAKAVVSFAPRPEFGQAPVHLRADDGGLRVFATNEPMVLRAPGVEWEIVEDGIHETARAVIDPSQGPVVLELRCGTEDLSESPVDEDSRRERAESYWRDWAATLALPELNQSLMKRSALTLRGLCTPTPARSWPRPPPRCPRRSAASATGTTATAGCATPR